MGRLKSGAASNWDFETVSSVKPKYWDHKCDFHCLNIHISAASAASVILWKHHKKKSFQLGWEGKLATERTTLRRRHQGLQAYPILFSLPSFLRYNSSNSGFNSLITLLFDYSFSYSDWLINSCVSDFDPLSMNSTQHAFVFAMSGHSGLIKHLLSEH